MNFEDLPDIVIEKIFSFLTYNQIAENRIVSRKFNDVGKEMLNRGYYMVERFHRKSLKAVKSKLPRRESERKIHPLSRHCDILMAVETRLSMLSMTFIRYIEARLCCFIPGKAIDELLRVLRFVNTFVTPPNNLLQELRDITLMAMEHFDEKIAPNLKEKPVAYRATTTSSNIADIVLEKTGNKRIAAIIRTTPCTGNQPANLVTYRNLFSVVRQTILRTKSNRNLLTTLSLKSRRIQKQVCQLRVIETRRQNKLMGSMKSKLVEQGKEIRRLRRVVQCWETKFRDLSAEVRELSRHKELRVDEFPLSDIIVKPDVLRNSDNCENLKKRKL